MEAGKRQSLGLKADAFVAAAIDESIVTKNKLKMRIPQILEVSHLISRSLAAGGKVVLFGNGGSAADAQHIAAEFVGRFSRNRAALAAIALTTNTSSLTAIGNDYGFEHIFERQVQALCKKGDVVIGISASGMSENVVLGLKAARAKGATCVALTGETGGKVGRLADVALKVPSASTPRIQECHILIGHVVSGLVEGELARRQ